MPFAMQNTPRVRLLKEVATGPMSAIFAAESSVNGRNRLLCIKVLHANSPAQLERLRNVFVTANTLTSLNHRHIIAPEDLVHVNGHFGLISEYVDGLDLQDWLDVLKETDVSMPKRVTCEIIRGIAVALETAQNRVPQRHSEPLYISHNDLKPTNVVVDRDGELKVVDFQTGFNSLSGTSARSGALQKGLIKYISPGRQEGYEEGEYGDVYSLGIMAIELLRGEWLKRIRNHNPAHDRYLGEVVANLPDLEMRSDADDRSLRNVLLRMVAFDMDSRPAINEIAATFRTLTDRAAGPSLESFAHAHAVPWLESIQHKPEPRLADCTIEFDQDKLEEPGPEHESETTAEGSIPSYIAATHDFTADHTSTLASELPPREIRQAIYGDASEEETLTQTVPAQETGSSLWKWAGCLLATVTLGAFGLAVIVIGGLVAMRMGYLPAPY